LGSVFLPDHRPYCVYEATLYLHQFKRLVGRSENAVRTQIIIAMIAYLLLKIANQSLASKLSLQQLATLVSVNIMKRRNIDELLLRKPPPKLKNDGFRQMQLAAF